MTKKHVSHLNITFQPLSSRFGASSVGLHAALMLGNETFQPSLGKFCGFSSAWQDIFSVLRLASPASLPLTLNPGADVRDFGLGLELLGPQARGGGGGAVLVCDTPQPLPPPPSFER